MVKPPARDEVRVFRTAADLRRWYDKNHAAASELWVGTYKKGVPKQSVSLPEATDEALCFGWIDSIGRRIDDEIFALRFTPRRPRSNWSQRNIERFGELQRAGRVHTAGLRAFEAGANSG